MIEWLGYLLLFLPVIGFFGGCPDCCEDDDCTTCIDPFNRPNNTDISLNSPCGWAVSGSAQIINATLELISGGAIAVCNQEHDSEFVTVTCLIKAGANTDRQRIYVGYQDSTHYNYVEFRSNTMLIVSRNGGSESQISSASISRTAGVWYSVQVCVRDFGDGAKRLIGRFGTAAVSSIIVAYGRKVALGNGTLSSLSSFFDTFTFVGGDGECSQCPVQYIDDGCTSCIGRDAPLVYRVAFTGYSNDLCQNCTKRNATFYVTHYLGVTNGCQYRSAFSHAWSYILPFSFPPTCLLQDYTIVDVFVKTAAIEVSLNNSSAPILAAGFCGESFALPYVAGTLNCLTDSAVVPWVSGNCTGCTRSSPTATVTPVLE